MNSCARIGRAAVAALFVGLLTDKAAVPLYFGSMIVAIILRYINDSREQKMYKELVPTQEVEIIDKLDHMPKEERPSDLHASVLPNELVLTAEQGQASLPFLSAGSQ